MVFIDVSMAGYQKELPFFHLPSTLLGLQLQMWKARAYGLKAADR